MPSRWFDIKDKALDLRQGGKSIRYVEKKLGIPRSTLSGWFKNIILTDTQLRILEAQHQKGMIKGRKNAVLWHNQQKENHLSKAKTQALDTLSHINFKDVHITELALSMLYIGEGSKDNLTSIGNTNPLILKFFISCLYKLYAIKPAEIKCDLHLRYDQDPKSLIRYWSKTLSIPQNSFHSTKDIRTKGSKTYPNYKGVCIVRCGKMAILRKLVFLSEEFCNKIVTTGDNSFIT